MSVVVSDSGSRAWTPHPEKEGPAVCVDVVDLGMQEYTWQGKTGTRRRGYLAFYMGERIDVETDDGVVNMPHLVFAFMTLSLHEKANLRKFLERWRGKAFTAAELRGFDLETLVGAPCHLIVEHSTVGDKTYANIALVRRYDKKSHGPVPDYPDDYVRRKDRPDSETPASDHPLPEPGVDDDIPF